nr:hypothetical protein [Spirochaetaceae bacterium]
DFIYPWQQQEEIISQLNEKIPELEIISLEPISKDIPDFQLYQEIRNQFFNYLETINIARTEEASQRAGEEWVNKEKLQVLEDYGKLITEYPLLLDFFAIDQDNGLDRRTSRDLLPINQQ